MSFDEILTARLRLRLMPPAVLKALARKDWTKAAAGLGLDSADGLDELQRLAAMRLKQLKADPAYLPWSLRAIILKQPATMAGYCNFHGLPGSDGLARHGRKAIEIGYAVLPAHRRRGYAFEAIQGLIGWARPQGCDALVLSIAPDNVASLRLAARLGAVKAGEHLDEEDGLEYVFAMRLV